MKLSNLWLTWTLYGAGLLPRSHSVLAAGNRCQNTLFNGRLAVLASHNFKVYFINYPPRPSSETKGKRNCTVRECYKANATPANANSPATTPGTLPTSPTAAPVCVLEGEVEVLLAVLLDSALVMFLQDVVAFEGTETLLDKVKSAHYIPSIERGSSDTQGIVDLEDT